MSAAAPRARLAMYSAAGCGGCEVAVLNLGDRLPDLARRFEIVFAPMLADFRIADLEALPDAAVDVCLFNGSVRTREDEAMAHLLRRKSRFLVAFGACAEAGGVPALAGEAAVRDVFGEGGGPVTVAGRLPALRPTAASLDEVELVDYTVPGCPPEPARLWAALEALAAAAAGDASAPEPGATLGAFATTVCEECPLTRAGAKVKRLRRLLAPPADPTRCLLEQGFVCLGVATRGGCGALCPRVGVPCNGCYGTPAGVVDQGARMIGALAGVLEDGAATGESLCDPVGTLYGFSLRRSLLVRPRPEHAWESPGEAHGKDHD